MKLSIVSTLYQSSPYITEFYQRSSIVARQLVGEDYEIILVNDGSPDNSLELAVQLTMDDSHVVVIDLSRNFGHHKAIMTGLEYSTGERIFLLDSDLEEDPAWLYIFNQHMLKNDCDVVYGVQKTRKGGVFEKLNGHIFYWLINYLTASKLPVNPTVARLMNKAYVKALTSHREHDLYIGGLMYLTGFDQQPCVVKKQHKGATVYTLRKKLAVLLNSITSLSSRPLLLIFYLGVVVSLLAFLFTTKVVIQSLFFDSAVAGWTSIIGSIWLSCGLIMLSIGTVGIYISKIFTEVKNRPYTIIRNIYGAPKSDLKSELSESEY